MKVKITKETLYKIFIVVAIFWLTDFIMHITGVGESNYYYLIKFSNSVLFALIWFTIFDSKKHIKKFLFSVIFGTWVSFSYLVSSYSGFVQEFFGIVARYSAPPFMIFGIMFHPILWWVYHIFGFYLGLEASEVIKTKKK